MALPIGFHGKRSGEMKLSIIIPVHNEVENLISLYEDLVSVLDDLSTTYEVITVNDGSEDASGRILDELAEKDSRFRVIHMMSNYGQSTAMMAGFDHATGDIIIAMDGDNQNDPKGIPQLLAKMEQGYDVVSGWRKDRKDSRFTKIIPSRIANWLISMISGVRLHDYGCSLKAYRRDVIKGIKLYGELHRFIPILLAGRGARVAEIVVGHRSRLFGSSHYGLSRVIKVLLDLILIKFLDKYLQHPIHFFGGFGVINYLLAGLTFALMVYYKYWENTTFIETPLPTLAVLFILTGTMTILMGILAEIVMRTYYESQNKKTYRILNDINSKDESNDK